jgi:Putative MetA-pathway of phenol degradation
MGLLRRFSFLFATFIILSKISFVNAQELEPRAYSNVPVGLNFFIAGYNYSVGGVLFDPAVPLENASITTHSSLFAYARSIKVGKISGKIDAIVPYAWLSGSADFMGERNYREVSGLGDPRLRMSVIFIGGPALPLSGFKDYKQNFVMGASLQVYLPLGQYNADKLVNLGTNRFTFKPEIGISKTIKKLILELALAGQFYTVNNNYYNGQTMSQDPIGSVQGHINYNFRGGIWAAFDGTIYWGGKTTIEGVEGDNLQQNSRLGFTFALPLNMHHSLKLNLSTGVSTRTGSDFDAVTLAWQYRWGAGLPKRKKS